MIKYIPFFLILPLPLFSKASNTVDFAREVLPVLSDKCYACHGPDTKKKDLVRLDLEELAKQFSAHSWGLVIFWMAGHVELDELVNQRVWAMKLMLAGVVTETVRAGLLR
mgnify:CR=1 FL=1